VIMKENIIFNKNIASFFNIGTRFFTAFNETSNKSDSLYRPQCVCSHSKIDFPKQWWLAGTKIRQLVLS
jgi:hypothetical protein